MILTAPLHHHQVVKTTLESNLIENTPCFFTVFETRFGWIGFRGADEQLSRVTLGHRQRNDAVQQLTQDNSNGPRVVEDDWFPELRSSFELYAQGEYVEFPNVTLAWNGLTPFQKLVYQATLALPYGATSSYREIAERIGRPRAARAVGNALAANRFPLLIPCHRILASGGGLGGFTAPQGTSLKARLLEMERRHVANESEARTRVGDQLK